MNLLLNFLAINVFFICFVRPGLKLVFNLYVLSSILRETRKKDRKNKDKIRKHLRCHEQMRLNQPVCDIPGTSHEGPIVRDLLGKLRWPSGYQKIENSTIKLYLGSNSPFITYLFLYFNGVANITVLKYGHPRDVLGTQLRDVPRIKLWNVLGKSMDVNQIQILNTSNLLWLVS